MPSGVVCCVILISSGSASTLQPSRSGEMNSTLVRYSAFFVSMVYRQLLGAGRHDRHRDQILGFHQGWLAGGASDYGKQNENRHD